MRPWACRTGRDNSRPGQTRLGRALRSHLQQLLDLGDAGGAAHQHHVIHAALVHLGVIQHALLRPSGKRGKDGKEGCEGIRQATLKRELQTGGERVEALESKGGRDPLAPACTVHEHNNATTRCRHHPQGTSALPLAAPPTTGSMHLRKRSMLSSSKRARVMEE